MNKSKSSCNLIDSKMEDHQLGGSKHCPGCGHKLEGKPDWVGLPAGVKFDPTDQELIEHLEAKVEGKESKSHPLIDEFIPTIEGEDGICYTHPEKLPGVTRDGLSRHFFHRPSKAYTTGTRKRRKIQTECDIHGGETRWHKTGKTRPVMANGKQKGCKKILVLYTNFGKNRKPEKTNWVMHQYHLGKHEEEKEGELVVSKIFYQTQPRQCNWSERSSAGVGVAAVSDSGGSSSSQRDEFATATANLAGIPSYTTADIHRHFGFLPVTLTKTFDEGERIGEESVGREAGGGGACEDVTGEPRIHHHQHQITTAFNIHRPSHSVSAIISPASMPMILDQDHSFDVPPIINLRHQNFQSPAPAPPKHHKLGVGSSTSGLEEIIMGCTSSDIKEESSMANQQEAEWLKYSTFWQEPDRQNHHG